MKNYNNKHNMMRTPTKIFKIKKPKYIMRNGKETFENELTYKKCRLEKRKKVNNELESSDGICLDGSTIIMRSTG